ncbi:Vitamin B12 import ATP-binding protein BtuD [bioreactor metagenome]|uniref:Vitamin B12 import ATP-binding protein BtuD n=1 Tax=bioreactor metagenome TaxID=1076179 RepID=A0A644YR96_9ZZZZ
MESSVVSVSGLVKRYGSFNAVSNLSFEVKPGEVFGLLGPNGAGKTTTLECLEGMRKADAGTLRIASCDPQGEGQKLRSRLGVQLQSSSLPDNMTAGEAFDLFSAWHGVTPDPKLAERFNIAELSSKQFKQLSTGQKRRLQLVLALVNHPQVVILDEPTAGLDVQSRASLHDEIRTLKAEGITVLLATHDMAEAEELCDRIAIVIHGKLAVLGTPQEVTAAGNKETRILLRTRLGSLLPGESIGEATFVEGKEGYLEWKSRNVAGAVMELLQYVQRNGDSVEDLRVERPSLEERFLEMVEGN